MAPELGLPSQWPPLRAQQWHYGAFLECFQATDTESNEKDNAMAMKASGMEANNLLHSKEGGRPRSSSTPSTWSPPDSGLYKMNTDGAARAKQVPGRLNTGPSGYGGILRNDSGQWVRGFRGFIGVSDCLTAEFHGILKGLQLLDKLGLKESILESDCKAAIDLIEKHDCSNNRHSQVLPGLAGIIVKCRRLVRKNRITINHVDADTGNRCADKLANMGIDNGEDYVDIDDLPDKIKELVNDDLVSFKKSSSYHGYPY